MCKKAECRKLKCAGKTILYARKAVPFVKNIVWNSVVGIDIHFFSGQSLNCCGVGGEFNKIHFSVEWGLGKENCSTPVQC